MIQDGQHAKVRSACRHGKLFLMIHVAYVKRNSGH